jgi:tetratricopeptide (TPR) repeat protein
MRVLKEGTRLAGRYTLVRRLGSGGMSEVWLARDERAEQRVALKFLLPALARDPRRRTQFHNEWQASSRLMHPHIVRVFEYHDDEAGPFYSQQFIDGPDAGVVAGQPPMESLRPLGLIVDALRYAHAKGYVHRDIKASNVLFDDRGAPYLIDFGIAGAPGKKTSGGSPIAQSPQQRAGEPPVPADDIYALGVLFHEILTGRPPSSKLADPGRTSPGVLTSPDGAPVPEEFARIIRDMLSAEAPDRPSAEALLERLREAGVMPGPASLQRRPAQLRGTAIPAETVPSITPVRPHAVREAPAADGARVRGVSPRMVFGGLAMLVVAFLVVIFWLPNAVQVGGERSDERAEPAAAADTAAGGDDAPEAEEPAELADPATEAGLKAATDESLGDLLSRLERLRYRGIEKWGGQTYLNVLDVYERGDRAYLGKDYRTAGELYREAADMLEPFFDRIDDVFNETMRGARAAFDSGDHAEAVRLYDLAVSITPGNTDAEQGLARARNLAAVLDLVDQGRRFETELDLRAAKTAFEKALELDAAWQPAQRGLERVTAAIRERSFEQRMTEGLDALAAGNFQTARAAFNAAKELKPDSQQPVDGLLRVDQEIRLANIRRLEREAMTLENNEEWQGAIAKYQEIEEIDSDLQFVREGLVRARQRAAVHERLKEFISDPDSLSAPATMQAATQLLLQVTTMNPTGPRLEDQKNELSRLLKRAATPLTVQLVSDNATEVSIYRVGKLGTFTTQELSLPPGAYVATGSRMGFRDVRLEFRVAPELDPEPIVIMCEERI